MFDCLKKLFDDVETGELACQCQCLVKCENRNKENLISIEDK